MATTTTRDGNHAALAGAAQRLAAIADELADQFLERSAVIRALIVAVLAGQHSLLLGPPGTAKSELAWLNERIYHPENGGAPIACPLIAAITASNELPGGEELSAVYDRLLVRLEVGYLQDPSAFAALVKSAVTATSAPAARTRVDLADLRAAVETGVPAGGRAGRDRRRDLRAAGGAAQAGAGVLGPAVEAGRPAAAGQRLPGRAAGRR